MSFEDTPEFQKKLMELKYNFKEHLLDLMANDGDGMVEVINDDASSLVPPELSQDVHMEWIEALVGQLEMWVVDKLQVTDVKSE